MELIAKDLDDDPFPPDNETLVIEDRNTIFYSSAREFQGNCRKDFPHHGKKTFGIFSTDMCHQNSVKAVEKLRRGSVAKLIVGGENTKKPKEWKSFLANNENKKQLIEALLAVWSSDSFKDNIREAQPKMWLRAQNLKFGLCKICYSLGKLF